MRNQSDDTRNNLDKRTARTRHAEWFKKGIEHLRAEYLTRTNEAPRSFLHSVQVYARIRPMLEHEVARGEYTTLTCVGPNTVAVHNCLMKPDMVHKYIDTQVHEFSRVFDEATPTATVYEAVARPLVQHVLSGGESVCMMYGQTGSGKTHTMTGFLADMGRDLMALSTSIQMTAVELVGSKCVDLLHDRTKVLICESEEDQAIHLVHSQSKVATSVAELLALFHEAVSRRATESTQANTVSSRSHLIVFLKLVGAGPPSDGGQMVLLDLAGSERKEDQFTNDKQRQQETIETNMSHLALKQCLLAKENNSHVPYRNSALTRILKNSLWAAHKSCQAAVVVTASPIPADTEHTMCSLLNARRMVEVNPTVVQTVFEITETSEAKPIKLFKSFSHADVQKWLGAVSHGELEAYVDNIKPAITGAALLRFPPARLTQLCNGHAGHAKLLLHAMKDYIAKENEERARERDMRRANLGTKF
ncbi:hypothetical protein H310_14610 [Aphanomyces invadans]|uniref:Kinesin motor domain-containing protein n=1 Tax=Aphanomyces invadans TaxID=157072 RepID=A0A024T9C7_9STRA|nr:hypothetical protein H310_14610 [Aphanomyces invadans]ETV90653.1 hypothetical protein H310_14610 [Aphanomyces invadans]|eukprot:XP_008880723.1 hypothetical protein H310_14610 [Aphanomyces invadans]